MTNFHNPYNFIPAPPPAIDGELGQRKPVGHHRWHPDLWNGRIGIRIEAVTPLLIPDGSGIEYDKAKDHKTYRTQLRNGQPHLPITTLKGTLRSAYEAITNSRFGVFEKHDERLAYRMEAKDGLRMVPARVDETGGVKTLQLFFGTHTSGSWPAPVGGVYGPPGNLMYAAWLKSYGGRNGGLNQTTDSIRHGSSVTCVMKKVRRGNFWFWEATSCVPMGSVPNVATPAFASPKYVPDAATPPITVDGYVCETNQSIGRKHDERVFFTTDPAGPISKPWNTDWDSAWTALIGNYKKQAEKALEKRRKVGVDPWFYDGSNIGETSFSRHLYAKGAETLKGGDLCYAHCDNAGNISGLYPVMISRQVYDCAPRCLLPKELWPATDIDKLSPADRVFGWVGEAEGKEPAAAITQHRGQLRIITTEFDAACLKEFPDEKAVAEFPDGLPLAILGQPKPQQARFYVAKDKDGNPQADGGSKEERGYSDNKGLRGRKVYPHQPSIASYWDANAALADAQQVLSQSYAEDGSLPKPLQQGGMIYREYVRRVGSTVDPHGNFQEQQQKPHASRDNQNRSIKDWIKPKSVFLATIDVVNMTKTELGALLYLFRLGDSRCLKLGGGKPLGFGSVKVSLQSLDVWTGKDKAEHLKTLATPARRPLTGEKALAKADEFKTCFWQALVNAYPDENGSNRISSISFIKAFLVAAEGFAAAKAHYPRIDEWPNPAGENFSWFSENERGPRLALPGLEKKGGSPMPLHRRNNKKRYP